MPLFIECIPALLDNYIWLLRDTDSGCTAAVDPGAEQPVLDALARHAWRLDWILNTHHHHDHTGANLGLKCATGCRIAGAGPDRHRIPGIDLALEDNDIFALGSSAARAMSTPGHTAGHLCFWFERNRALFSGDTLFLMGCGRLVEGDAATLQTSLLRLAALPQDTRVYCAHEYTLANARFACTVDPENPALQRRLATVKAQSERGEPTVPARLAEELDTNPFLRTTSAAIAARLGLRDGSPADVFAELRRRKDRFR